jgi:heparanase 1
MRWANFADSIWYADDLASKAASGYAAFCRQDYIGGDYGMLDCSTGVPLPDFWTALVWARTMGAGVLRAAVATDGSSAVRAYAHCAPGVPGGVTVLLINLSPVVANITLSLSAGSAAPPLHLGTTNTGTSTGASTDWELSPDPAAGPIPGFNLTGLFGAGLLLNGQALALGPGKAGKQPLPAMEGRPGGGTGSTIAVPPTSILFRTFHDSAAPACQ